VVLIREQFQEALEGWERARPGLEPAVVGLRGEIVGVTDAGGARQALETAGRIFFEGRDLLFLRRPGRGDAFAAEVKPGARLEPVSDEAYLGRLRAHLEGLGVPR
jgi:hypothetical protein